MLFTYKKKSFTALKELEQFVLNGEKVNGVDLYFVPATLTTEYAYLIVVMKTNENKKKYGECLFLRSESWLKKQTDDENDSWIVDSMNNKIKDHFEPVDLSLHVEAMPGSKMEKDSVFIVNKILLCPSLEFYFNFEDVDVIFYERFTSYTKTFDVTFVMKNKSRESLFLVERKKYMSTLDSYFKSKNIEVVKTGPDPVSWDILYESHYKEGVSWKDAYEVPTDSEEEEEEWVAGSTEDETEEDFTSDEEEYVPEMPLEKKRKLDKEWDDRGRIIDDADYDKWEKKQKV